MLALTGVISWFLSEQNVTQESKLCNPSGQGSNQCGTRDSSSTSTSRSCAWCDLWWRTMTQPPRMISSGSTVYRSPASRTVRKSDSDGTIIEAQLSEIKCRVKFWNVIAFTWLVSLLKTLHMLVIISHIISLVLANVLDGELTQFHMTDWCYINIGFSGDTHKTTSS